jgi:hypothetical protein
MVIFFNLCLILTVIFSKFLKPNAAEMLRERGNKKKKKGWGKSCGEKKKKNEREMKSKNEERENIFV